MPVPSVPTMSAHHIASSGDIEALILLLKHHCQDTISRQDAQGKTPLICAVEGCQPESALMLIEAGSPLNHQDSWGYTALYWACLKGEAVIASRLLAAGACWRLRTRGAMWTPLIVAASRGHWECVKVLLRHPGMVAEGGAVQVDLQGGSALLYACMHGRTEAASILVMRGMADPHEADSRGRTPASVARERGHYDTLMRAIEDQEKKLMLYKIRCITEPITMERHHASILQRRQGQASATPQVKMIEEEGKGCVAAVARHAIRYLNDDLFRDLLDGLAS